MHHPGAKNGGVNKVASAPEELMVFSLIFGMTHRVDFLKYSLRRLRNLPRDAELTLSLVKRG